MLDKLIMLLGSDADSAAAEFCLNETIQNILNYCGIDELPLELEYTAVKMAADAYRNEGYGTASVSCGAVSSVSIGDISTSFNAFDNNYGQSILKDYVKALNRFRRVRFR